MMTGRRRSLVVQAGPHPRSLSLNRNVGQAGESESARPPPAPRLPHSDSDSEQHLSITDSPAEFDDWMMILTVTCEEPGLNY